MKPSLEEVEALELKIAYLLRYGVVLAGLLLAAGWMGGIQFRENPFLSFQTYHAEVFTKRLHELFGNGQANWDSVCIYAGLLALISLPLLRVLMTAVLFLKQRDFRMALVATFVLVVLVVSFSLGLEL